MADGHDRGRQDRVDRVHEHDDPRVLLLRLLVPPPLGILGCARILGYLFLVVRVTSKKGLYRCFGLDVELVQVLQQKLLYPEEAQEQEHVVDDVRMLL